MIHEVILPDDPFLFEPPMVKFKFITEDYALSFVIQDKFSEKKLREALKDIDTSQLNDIVDVVVDYYVEEQIGEAELSEISSVVAIKRILSG